ncbi:hypothetical protein VAWG006_37990 [Aeromonas enteropelogenes]|nr:hypothetical protein VAWG006_37990 [Aeromonas enteropelogenes]BEE23709.1 hypothetical protein VAWG007_38040 [Aeromonas enteropelogenes]
MNPKRRDVKLLQVAETGGLGLFVPIKQALQYLGNSKWLGSLSSRGEGAGRCTP